ncbi:MAG: nitrous oxide-stimulated promoter family protein [Bacteroidales bacterium]|jgi:hypothetical protein|nr:nitrous oxide-stimulated promoter family protein [Bacteroidales bacterium]
MKTNQIEREKRMVAFMIGLYCRCAEGNTELCERCCNLIHYAHFRLDACKYGNEKPECKRCTVHCYKPEMREQIRAIMRFAGKRMIFYAPQVVLHHFLKQ